MVTISNTLQEDSENMDIDVRDLQSHIASLLQPYQRLAITMLISILLISCQCSCSTSIHTKPREVLDAEVDALPLPPGSQILARYDGISTGQIVECQGVITDLLIGNSLPAADVYRFYRDELVARGWQVTLEVSRGVVLKKNGRYGIEISDNYYVSTGIPRDTIKSAESQFESLVFIGIGYSFYEPEKCQKAIDALGNP
jgi:hypothetical protein